jgi:phosphoglycolate phosphatase-like HAD superfamily hydrolase
MRVGFDLDGVLADLHGAYARTARALFPALDSAALAAPNTAASPPADDEPAGDASSVDTAPALSRDQARQVWDQLCRTENFWETLAEIEPGSVRRLAELS